MLFNVALKIYDLLYAISMDKLCAHTCQARGNFFKCFFWIAIYLSFFFPSLKDPRSWDHNPWIQDKTCTQYSLFIEIYIYFKTCI